LEETNKIIQKDAKGDLPPRKGGVPSEITSE